MSKDDDDSLPTFSSSILRLEICGPKEDRTISAFINVPGIIFRTTSQGLPTKEGQDHGPGT